MISLQRNVSLQSMNTMAIPAVADYFAELNTESDVLELVLIADEMDLPIHVMGGGSNLVLCDNVPGIVVLNKLKGIHRHTETGSHACITVGAGENWHGFVQWCIEHSLFGLENLALIPGTVGAAPVQNIGAYGVEVADLIDFVAAFDLITKTSVIFRAEQCLFGYRDSVFKQCKGRYLITSVGFCLPKHFKPNLDYGPLQSLKQVADLAAQKVFNTVVQVRSEKLPNPDVTPNAGSFFKNPIVSNAVYQTLKTEHPAIVAFPHGTGYKLAAGWLIDQCGLKGQSNDAGVGCYHLQALVLVNPNKALYEQVMAWAQYVQKQVYERFSVKLDMEPQIWG